MVAPEFTEALNRRRAALLAGEVTMAQVEEWREEMDELEVILPTRFAADVHRRGMTSCNDWSGRQPPDLCNARTSRR